MACTCSFKLMEKDNSVGWKGRGKNVSKCDTKGCLPLEVQIKKYLLAGHKLEELRSVNTFEDYDEAYKDIPIITQDMDITEILELEQKAQSILKMRAQERLATEQQEEKEETPPEPQKNEEPSGE